MGQGQGRTIGGGGIGIEDRGLLCDGGDAWSSLHLSVIALGCLNG